jgi:PadR family transcriptional regulator PadR
MIKGVLDLALLAILRERSRYGLEILQCMNEEGGLDVADGTIYPLLHRMEANGFVSAEWRIEGDQGRPRKYYALTRKGTAELSSLSEEWRELRARVEALIKKGTR